MEIGEFHVFHFWWYCYKLCSARRVFFTCRSVWVFLPKSLCNKVATSCRHTWELPTSAFELELPRFPLARPTLYLLYSFTGLTGHPDPCDETPSERWSCNTRLVGRALAIGDPSLEVVSCPRFDMAPITKHSLVWERERELLKLLEPEYVVEHMMLTKHRSWFRSFLEKLPLVRMSASCFLVSTYLIWIFGIQVDPIKQPIKSDSVSSRHMSQRGTSSLKYHLDHDFAVFKKVQLRFPLRRTCLGGYVMYFAQLIKPFFFCWHVCLVSGITNCRVLLNILKFSWATVVGLGLLKFPRACVTRLNVVLGCP